MRVFQVRADSHLFQALVPREIAAYEKLELDGTPVGSTWSPPAVCSDCPNLGVPDLWMLNGMGRLLFSPAMAKRFASVIARAGELLPLPYKGETWQLLNTTSIDCLDGEASEWLLAEQDGAPPRRIYPTRYVFDVGRLPASSLFKIPETCRGSLYCLDGVGGRAEEFLAVMEDEGLTGLRFELLWDAEA